MATSEAAPHAVLDRDAIVLVAGARTLIGSALVRRLRRHGFRRVLGGPSDFTDQRRVERWFARHHPQYVFVAAGRSGGIGLNQSRPADLMRDNLLSACHVITAAHRFGVARLLYLASSCSYPKAAPQPLAEPSLLTGALEPTSAAYALAKISGIGLCEAYQRQHGAWFVPAIPADAFGVGDDFDPAQSHVIAALIRKMHDAKLAGAPHVELWGTGSPRREFIFADDLADACVWVMERASEPSLINLGGGSDLSIREVAEAIQQVVGYTGALRFDHSKADGAPRKRLESSQLLSLGWRPATALTDALTQTYRWFLEHHAA